MENNFLFHVFTLKGVNKGVITPKLPLLTCIFGKQLCPLKMLYRFSMKLLSYDLQASATTMAKDRMKRSVNFFATNRFILIPGSKSPLFSPKILDLDRSSEVS